MGFLDRPPPSPDELAQLFPAKTKGPAPALELPVCDADAILVSRAVMRAADGHKKDGNISLSEMKTYCTGAGYADFNDWMQAESPNPNWLLAPSRSLLVALMYLDAG